MTDQTVHPGRLSGTVRVPGDKSISHRALLLGALAEGTTAITGLSGGEDVAHTAAAVGALGAGVDRDEEHTMVIGGRDRLHSPDGPLDMGNSGTGMRLLAGLVAGLPFTTVLVGDRWLTERPMERIAVPLRLMGATVDGRSGGRYPPLTITGGGLHGIDYPLPVPSAQVKGAVLLAGLGADGATIVREPGGVRAHTEEMLAAFGADIDVAPGRVTLRPSPLRATAVAVPGDPSQAAFWIVAGCVVPDSDVTVEAVYVGPGRAGFLGVLQRMGADIELTYRDATTADIRARSSELKATVVEGDEVPALIDEIPVLAVAAATATGTTEFRDAAELTVKETNRVLTTTAMLGALGVDAEGRADGLVVHGGARLRGAGMDSAGDHRIAMAAAVGGLAADGPSRLRGWEAVATSYPGFADELERLQG